MLRKLTYWFFVRIPVWFVFFSLTTVLLLKWVPVRYTPLMLKRAFQFREVENYHTEQEWVSLEYISPALIKAVVVAEDSRFYEHRGFDWTEIRAMWKAHRQDRCRLRGCSTISQQTAKNNFTFGTHTWARKAFEAWWTVLVENIWGKERILEVYINVAEFGRGIYGIGAAAKAYYQCAPGDLDINEAATLAACLPAPLEDQPGNLTVRASIRKRGILERMQKYTSARNPAHPKLPGQSSDTSRYFDSLVLK